jgi:hypothetical protein
MMTWYQPSCVVASGASGAFVMAEFDDKGADLIVSAEIAA